MSHKAQKSILNYFSPASSAGKNTRPNANENSPGQRGGGDVAIREDATPVKRPASATGDSSKRGNKWINRLNKDEADQPLKRQKIDFEAAAPIVDISIDDDYVEPSFSPSPEPKESPPKPTSTRTTPIVPTPSTSKPKVSRPSTSYSTPKTQPKKTVSTPSSALSSFTCREDKTQDKVGFDKDEGSSWPPKDRDYDFLRPKNIMDSKRRRTDHPEYDEKTVYVPQSFLDKRTEAQRQWWKIKSEMFDTALAFKVGKFYELFNMDALIGIEHLNLLPMGNSSYHSGFPEVSFAKYADILRERGFKVTRVEQTESNEARNRRLQEGKGSKKGAKVVNREVCQIISPGVSLLNDFDAESCNKHSSKPNYLLAVCQKPVDIDNRGIQFGVCFVDSAIGKVFISQFEDDQQCSRLRTLIAHHPPAELLIEKGYKNLTPLASSILKNFLTCVVKQQLKPETEFLSATNTLKYIREGRYFENEDGTIDYPCIIKEMLGSISNNPEVLPEFELAFRSLGAIIWNLRRCLVDEDLLTLKNFERYVPSDLGTEFGIGHQETLINLPKSMVMDAVTLDNLDILGKNPKDKKGNLFGLLNNCTTLFGERRLRSMVYSPSCEIDVINDRLDAIEDLEKCLKNNKTAFDFLKKIPDLEKILSKLHSESITRKRDHPDSRAQMFSDVDGKKVKSFLNLLDNFEKIGTSLDALCEITSRLKSNLIRGFLTPESKGGNLPNLRAIVREFKRTFDINEARTNGVIVPEKGTDPDYDECCRRIEDIKDKLEEERRRESSAFKCDVQFVDAGKKKFLLKVPEKAIGKRDLPSKYLAEGSVKGFKRFYTKEIERLVVLFKEAEEAKDPVMAKIRRNLFARFCIHQPKLMEVVKCLALLDALLSLTKSKIFMQRYSMSICRPNFVAATKDKKPFISIRDGSNPIIMQKVDNCVPNDVELSDKLIILTGPNMGGKSTLMRSVGLIVVMAQIGSFVPASSVEMTPVDRIFTRLGAADNIVEGESTFMVELNQTCTIVKHATPNSLVLLDELGRGTATHDGTAIAYSVVDQLACNIKCRTLFATHYHSLVEEFQGNPSVISNHMSCLVEKDEKGNENIHFLYKLENGDCPKSYGFHAARLAGLPDEVVKVAEIKAHECENEFQFVRKIRSLFKTSEPSHAKKLLVKLKELIMEE